jgi:hypothetical protein
MQAAAGLAHQSGPQAADALAALTDPSEGRGLRGAGLRGLVQAGDTARALTVATRGLTDYDPLYAQMAVQTLARMDTPQARAALRAAAEKETRVHVRDAIERALNGRRSGR